LTERRTLDEAYESATDSTNLTLTADKRSDCDILIASSWSDSRLGAALVRLHTKATLGRVTEIADQLSLPRRRINEEIIPQVLHWWLHQACTACDGHGKTKIPGTPTLSAHQCPVCYGSCKKRIPFGEEGKRLANLLDDCVSRWRDSLRRRFQHQNR
jgi:hypothetical protein